MKRLAALSGLVAIGCGPLATSSTEPFSPTRFDYQSFARSHPDLLEPNYLPFMAHRMSPKHGDQDLIVFCRWDDGRFPLAVWVEAPQIGEPLQNEFNPKEPVDFVDAAWRALDSWQQALGGRPHFRRAESEGSSDLQIELIGSEGPKPGDKQVLGATPLQRACQLKSTTVRGGRVDVSFEVPRIQVYIADQYGLLPADQVERNVLHEVGHALGMRGHSPIPADLMYEVARDRRVERLSTEDVRSFRALYALPNGTVYAAVPHANPPARPAAHAPGGPPALIAQPYVDDGLGYSLRVADGWRLVGAPRGIVAIDGLAWDYEASFQVIVRSYPTIAAYVRRHGNGHLRGGELLAQGPLQVAGRPAFHMTVAQDGGAMIEEHVFVETGDGRVFVVIEEAPAELRDGFQPWFDAMLASLEILHPGALPVEPASETAAAPSAPTSPAPAAAAPTTTAPTAPPPAAAAAPSVPSAPAAPILSAPSPAADAPSPAASSPAPPIAAPPTRTPPSKGARGR